ncbi:MAG TPA: enoyl-CoA hydratase/isomerase family protein [Sphingobium sp.]|uniref:enoyl-CoA hydratase/isomerase family protein n=1 Tax=Sphingobium sp. TaxID=1912891 RepID=UPI002ED0406B
MITSELNGGIATIALARATSRNAFRLGDWTALKAALEAIVPTDARVIVLESALEAAFCAGSDLIAMESLVGQPALVAQFRTEMRAALDTLSALTIPTIANIQGDCFGAGVAIALACDFRVAGERARFAVTPAKLGISYPVEDIARLTKTVGAAQAGRLLMVADTISASDAHCIGLVQVLGEAQEAHRCASAIAKNAPQSVVTLKRLIRAVVENEALAFDDIFDGFFASEALVEGIRAFKEKRQPIYADVSRKPLSADPLQRLQP